MLSDDLSSSAAAWPTPNAHDADGTGRSESATLADRHHRAHDLSGAIKEWPTPTAGCKGPGGATLQSAVARAQLQSAGGSVHGTKECTAWPTPATNPQAPNKNTNTVKGPSSLQEAALLFPTPGANDWKGAARPGQRRRQLDAMVETSHLFRPGPETPPDGPPSSPPDPTSRQQWQTPTVGDMGDKQTPASNRGLIRQVREPGDTLRLNPSFVDWLMGWPTGWSACAPLETGSFRSWLASHSALLRAVCGWR
jgi:hypothetical protein